MRLTDALRLVPGRAVAFTGAGGKSAALTALAKESRGRVPFVATTTTRLGADQTDLASEHLPAPSLEILASRDFTPDTNLLVTGAFDPRAGKWTSPSPDLLAWIRQRCLDRGGILAVEADGARRRLVKAPAEHEPVVPPWTDVVVPTVGLGAIGQSLGPDVAHRPERIAKVLGIQPGDRLTEELLARLLSAPEGGLQGVPHSAEVRLLLTSREPLRDLDAARRFAALALAEPRVRAAVLTGDAGADEGRRSFGRVAGVVLAAGGGSRLGRSKPLVEWKGRPLIRHVIGAAQQGGLAPIVVVVGAEAAAVRDHLHGEALIIVENEAWSQGQSTSVRAGLSVVREDIEAAVFLLADMPRVSGETIRRLIERHQETLAAAAPVGGGRRGNPVLFDRSLFPGLEALAGDQGGRSLLEDGHWAEVEADPAEFFDVDEPSDLDVLRGMS